MPEKEPLAEKMLSSDEATVTPWATVCERVSSAGSHWLATVRPDGSPHVVPVGAVWLEGALYFTTGQSTRKGKNLAHNSRCVLAASVPGLDVVVEGQAVKVRDEARLQPLAEAYTSHGWPATVRDGALDAPYSAPTTGPAPYDVYEVVPTTAFAFGTEADTVNRSTRYRF